MKFKVKEAHDAFRAGQVVTGVMILPPDGTQGYDLKIAIYHREVDDRGVQNGYWILWPAANFEPAE